MYADMFVCVFVYAVKGGSTKERSEEVSNGSKTRIGRLRKEFLKKLNRQSGEEEGEERRKKKGERVRE